MQDYDRYLQQAAIQARNPVNYKQVGDEWLDRLTLDGYPIREILQSIFARYRNDSVGFGRYIARRAASLKSSKYKVKNFLPRLPITMEINEIVPLLMDKYRISSDGAKLLLQDYLWIYQEQNQVYLQLKKRGMTVLKHLQGRTNTVVFFCDEQMKSNYQRFGDFVCVDFKPIKIHNIPKYRDYLVGVFTGQDTNLHHTLFGICLITAESEENYRIAIRQFIKAMRLKRYPESFIVGNSQILHRVIVQLSVGNDGERLFGCLMGWHHMMDKVAKIYKNHAQRDKIIEKFGNILSSLNMEQMNVRIKQLTSMLPGDEVITNFIFEYNKYFVAMNEPSFIGFGIEKYNFSMLYKIMYSFLKQAEGIGFIFQQALKMEEMLLSRIKKGYQLMDDKQIEAMGIICSDQLRYLSIRLEKKLFKKFLVMYRTAVKHAKIIATSPDGLFYQIAFKTQKTLPYKGYIYTVKYSLESSCWYCNCGFIYQSGIPCAHLIKIIRKFRGSLTYYINRRWMIQNSKFNPALINHPSQLKMRPEKQDNQSEKQIVNQSQVKWRQSRLEEENNISREEEGSVLSLEKNQYILDIDQDDQIGQPLHEQINMKQFQENQVKKNQTNNGSSPKNDKNFDQKQKQAEKLQPQNGSSMMDEKDEQQNPIMKVNEISQFYHGPEQIEETKYEKIHQVFLQHHVIENEDQHQINFNKEDDGQSQKSSPKIQIGICKSQGNEQIGIVLHYQQSQQIKRAFFQEDIKEKEIENAVQAEQPGKKKQNDEPADINQAKVVESDTLRVKQGLETENLQNCIVNKREKRRVKSITLFGPITVSYGMNEEKIENFEDHKKITKQSQNYPERKKQEGQLEKIKEDPA